MSDDTIRVRVDRGDYRHEREHYTRGDELDVAPKVLEQHPNSLTRIEEPDESPDSEDANTETADNEGDDEVTIDDLDPHPSDLTVPELEERIDDVEDADLLKTIKDAEKATEDRTGAKDALDDRIADLEG